MLSRRRFRAIEKKTLINDQSTDKSLNDVEHKEAVEKCDREGIS